MNNLFLMAGSGPILEIEGLQPLKDFLNAIMVPEISLPIFTVLFIGMIWGYKVWTKPIVFAALSVLFCVGYFGLFLVDANYAAILAKADNIPITLMILLTGLCCWVAFRQAAINDTNRKAGKPLIEAGREDKVLVWPDLVYSELICILLATSFLIVWGLLFRAPLEAPANPEGPPNPSKAPWYFLGLQEMLVYFDPWIAGVVLPGMIVTGLIFMPYYDTNPKGNGYYTLQERPFAIITWMFAFLILWMVLIVYGTFLRGPNWNFFGPTEYWDSHKKVALNNVNLSQYIYVYFLKQPVPAHWLQREWIGLGFVASWIFGLPVLLMSNWRLGPIKLGVMRNLYLQMGTLRYWVMAIHFVVMAMMPLKMVLRWFFNLKYFVYLPEFNLNI